MYAGTVLSRPQTQSHTRCELNEQFTNHNVPQTPPAVAKSLQNTLQKQNTSNSQCYKETQLFVSVNPENDLPQEFSNVGYRQIKCPQKGPPRFVTKGTSMTKSG